MVKAAIVGVGMAAIVVAFSAAAQKPIIYPAKGQSPEQQSKDDGECYVWAKQNTGIDPAAPPSAAAPQAAAPRGERVRGAARGAAGGAIIGEIADDEAGKGAAIGAVAGTMAGGRQQRKNQQAAAQQAQTQQGQATSTYYRAYAACMEGRGYTIK